ncbi:MAG: UDP-glucose 4-epimerase [Legionellales bacterium]|nr:UDP-glucose 4-epimerase [Legionellales bacterium]OUX65900.1 MAG: UDP-glucose 4-epimerase [Gammaproteobacteria bacterium TMED281]
MLNNSVLMITGGTGSFGRTVLKRFLSSDVSEVRIFSRDEKKQEDLRLEYNNEKLKFYIGDVRDKYALDYAMKGVDYVFHAAALKQVPSCEFYPLEAVRTNVLGTENVLRSATNAGAKKVIVLSTDKAVYPINAMGLSKSLAEKVMAACARQQQPGETVFCATRYGNIMGSRGSVIPLFLSQIKQSLPITITDPDMTRFLMYLDESVDLVMHAFEFAEQGDIFIQKAPACTIADLAESLMQLFDVKTKPVIIGTRHGEKVFESLVSREEMAKSIDLGKYYRIPYDDRDLNYSKFFNQGEMSIKELEDYTSHNTRRLSIDEIKDTLLKLEMIKNALLDVGVTA